MAPDTVPPAPDPSAAGAVTAGGAEDARPSAHPGRDVLIATHRELLARFRKVMNLVGPGDLDIHYEDCDAGLCLLDEDRPTGRWADLGSGAGFPGIPLAARYPELTVDLVDSRRKRCTFLEQVVAESGAEGIGVHCARIESLSGVDRYDGLVSRALAAPPEVLAMAGSLLAPGGRVLFFLQADTPTPSAPSFTLVTRRPYTTSAGHARAAAVLRFDPAEGELG